MSNSEKTILVDIDGTLADNSHRQGFLRKNPKNWKEYNRLMSGDTPYEDIVWLVKTLHKAGCKIVVVTARQGRPEILESTVHFLDKVAGLKGVYSALYHRDKDDYRDDSVVKLELLEQIKRDGYNPYMVLDDRNKVVKAWREAGLRCLQVQEGDF